MNNKLLGPAWGALGCLKLTKSSQIGENPSRFSNFAEMLIIPMEFFGVSEKDENVEREIVQQLKGINLSQLIQTVKKVMEEEKK